MKTIRFIIPDAPISKQRHRTAHGRTYDPQHNTKMAYKWTIAADMRNGGYKPLEGPIGVELNISYPMPQSWSKKKRKEFLGKFVITKPDNDNFEKFYFDVMNGIAYKDDCLIARNWCQKVYSETPGVEIELYSLEDNMVNEHAITYKDTLSVEDLSYIILKANSLGRRNREIVRVYQQEDSEGKHLYFEVDGMKAKDKD